MDIVVYVDKQRMLRSDCMDAHSSLTRPFLGRANSTVLVWLPPHLDTQNMFWCQNNKNYFQNTTLVWKYVILLVLIISKMGFVCELYFHRTLKCHLIHFRLNRLPHTIYWKSNSEFRYVRLCELDTCIPRDKWLNYLQTVETLIRCRNLRCLIWVCTVCQ